MAPEVYTKVPFCEDDPLVMGSLKHIAKLIQDATGPFQRHWYAGLENPVERFAPDELHFDVRDRFRDNVVDHYGVRMGNLVHRAPLA